MVLSTYWILIQSGFILHYLIITVLPILKKNYEKLCKCLPHDYVKTVDQLKQFISGIPDDYLNQLRVLQSTEQINIAIVGTIMNIMNTDDDVFGFCDIMEKLCDETTSKNYIKALRNGKLTYDIYYTSIVQHLLITTSIRFTKLFPTIPSFYIHLPPLHCFSKN